MKKITSLLLVAVLLFSGVFAVYASEYTDTLSAVGIMPAFSGGDNSPVARDELAYMTAKILNTTQQSTNTRFSDVDATNPYSGYIEYLAAMNVVSGGGGGNFSPKDYATYGMAAKMLVNVLGYDAFGAAYGGYPDGYIKVLSVLGIDKGVIMSADSVLTVDSAAKLFYNAITKELNGMEFSVGDSSETRMTSEKNDALLASTFGISVYKGTVRSTNADGTSISVLIEDNKFSSNPVMLAKGATETFSVASGISAESFVSAPCVLWVNEDKDIIKIKAQEGVEIKYAVIASINNSNQNFPISNIRSMTLLDDESDYDVSDAATLKFNGVYTQNSVNLNGNFAKIITKNDEVIAVESWDLVKGGLITANDGNTITYIKDGKTANIRNISSYKKVVTVIGTNGGKPVEIMSDTVFSYYQGNDYLVLIASEKKIVDVFKGVSSYAVTVGDVSYRKGDVYYSEDAVNFSNTKYAPLLNRNVAAYIGPDGYVWFVKAMNEADSQTREFYGIVEGIEQDTMDEDFAQIKIIEIAKEPVYSQFELTDKTIYNDGLTMNKLATTAKSTAGDGIYVFNISASGKVTSVSNPKPMYGYTSTDASVSSVGSVALVGLTPHYFRFQNTDPIVVLHTKKDKLALSWTTWGALYEMTASSTVKLRIFGEGKSYKPALMVLADGGAPTSEFGNQERYGVVTNVLDTIDSDGDPVKEVTVLMASGKKKYILTNEYAEAKNITKNAIIRFRDKAYYSDNDIIILDESADKPYVYPLSLDPDSWVLPAKWVKLTVEGADAEKLLVKNADPAGDPTAKWMHMKLNFIALYDADAPVTQFTLGTWSDIDDGDTVYCNDLGDGARGVIVIK